jgi:cyclopropane fatty-acyl-phospholipid synthase-like methyltransferase
MRTVTIEAIRDHYDFMAQVYRLFWGEHLHHGLFISGDERPRLAQEQMLKFCVRLLARDFDAHITGITISRKQAEFAKKLARRNGVRDRVYCG